MSSGGESLKLGLCATEASGDRIGSLVISEMRARHQGAAFCGFGLECMRQAGLASVSLEKDLAVMGYVDALRKLGRLLKVRRELVRSLLASPPSVFAGIDSPDFNFAVERKLKNAGTRVAHIVSPSLWAWRPERLDLIRSSTDLMICLFPFEERIYKDAGIPAVVVGHPDADESPDIPDKLRARERLGIDGSPSLVVAMMPGSRTQELSNHLATFLQAAKRIASRHPQPEFLIPAANESCHRKISEAVGGVKEDGLSFKVLEGRAGDCLEAADYAVVKSGTSTLQAMFRGVPMAIVYRMGAAAYRIVRMRKLHSRFIGLPNVLAGEEICAELLQEQATAENIAADLDKWLENPERAGRYRDRAMELKSALKLNAGKRMANALDDLCGGHGH